MEAARRRFADALHLDPSMSQVRTAWARAEAAADNIQQAREVFQAGVQASPSHVPLLHVSPGQAMGAAAVDVFRDCAAWGVKTKGIATSCPHDCPADWAACRRGPSLRRARGKRTRRASCCNARCTLCPTTHPAGR